MKLLKELFKRDDKKIQSLFTPNQDRIDIKSPLKIIFPNRFLIKDMAELASTMKVTGAFMVFNEELEYTVVTLPNLITLSPTSVETTIIDDEEYILMEFTGPEFIPNINTIDEADIIVSIISEFIISNNSPFYIANNDLFKLLTKSSKTTSSKVTKNLLVSELLTALVVKTKDGKTSARSMLSKDDINDINKTSILGIENIHSLSNNVSKIVGNYFNMGLTSALNSDVKSEETELERILKL